MDKTQHNNLSYPTKLSFFIKKIVVIFISIYIENLSFLNPYCVIHVFLFKNSSSQIDDNTV